MAFIRTKRIKKKSGNVYTYAYLVENKWKKRAIGKKKSRQKVKAYLGRVYGLDKKSDIDFLAHFCIDNVDDYIKSRDKKGIVIDLVKYELHKHGFDEVGSLVSNGSVFFDLDKVEFSVLESYKRKEGIVLSLNEGFMCKETVRRVMHFYSEGTEEEIGYKFAKAFVEAGIDVPKEVFVGLFGKLFK
ncbi:hypothetical protein KY360_04935 [Candidatus Woesearchaeota archaeon]|nr:hypothetical protein [Candidatus Woesearchaeota archaeon]